MDCRFCGKALIPESASARHAYLCEGNALNSYTFERLQQGQATTLAAEACTQEGCDKPATHCNYNYLPPESNLTKSVAQRFRAHSKSYHFDRTTSKYVCKPHSLMFSELSDYRIHMIQHHRAPVATVLLSNGEDILPGSMNFWCKICQVYIPRTESTEDDHFGPHLLEANDVMQPFGLAGLEFSHLWLHPAFCPFCLFDKDVPISVRMHSHDVKLKNMAHVEIYLTTQKDSVLRACPASMESGNRVQATCGVTTLMTKRQLKEHLVKDHNMMFSLKKPKRADMAGDEDDHEKVQEVEEGEDGGQSIAKENVRPKKKPRERLYNNHCERWTLTKDEVNCTSDRSEFTRTFRTALQTQDSLGHLSMAWCCGHLRIILSYFSSVHVKILSSNLRQKRSLEALLLHCQLYFADYGFREPFDSRK